MLQKRALHALRTLLTSKQVLSDQATLVAYEVDAGMDTGIADAVVFPYSTEEVARIVRWAVENQVALIARGAGTGLSGGAVAACGGVIVEFAHMQRVLAVDTQGRSALVEPALINLRLDERVKAEGLYFPPDPASQRASTIGGNVAENSGGPHCFKYGVTTNYVAGMRVVLADGSCVQLGGSAQDYPEYDLCGLMTGSEGMLGLMTEIRVRLLRNPPGVKTLLAVFDTVEQAGKAVSAVIAAGLVPATLEMMDQKIIGIIEPFAHAHLPLDAAAALIIDVDGYPQSLDAQMAEIVHILGLHGGYNMRVAHDEEERYKIWLARKSAGGAITREAPAYLTIDITVPRSRLAEILTKVNQICEHYHLRVGHLLHAGDGNLHPMVLIPEPDDPELLARVHAAGREMVQCCVEVGGSLTGEHGVGLEKRQLMTLMHNADELRAMWDVKQAFDPAGLLNPGKMLPIAHKDEMGPFADSSRHKHEELKGMQAAMGALWSPATALEAAQGLLSLAQAGKKILLSGTGPAQHLQASWQQVSCAALQGMKTYAPDDLYITVGAGTPLAEVQAFLARDGKQLALAAPWPTVTVGGLVAANVNAPLHMRYGALRDQVLCATVALADGRVIRTGRPIVKNVAGFDMTRIFVGSYGTLGLLIDVSLKISVQPRVRRTLLVAVNELYDGLRWGQAMLRLALNASAIVLARGYQVAGLTASKYLLAYSVEGMLEDVQAELEQVRQVLHATDMPEALEVEDLSGTAIWVSMLGQATETSVLVRMGVPIKDVPAYILAQEALLHTEDFIVDIGNGFVYTRRRFEIVEEANTWLEAVRIPARALDGYAVVMDMPLAWQGKLDRWGYQPAALALMQRLKMQWDASDALNPGVFVV